MTTPRLLDQVRAAIRVRHYSWRTEDTYVHWIRRFILFHAKRHPREMGEREVTAFLTYLAVNKNVAASTQNQALAAILFLYQKVLEMKLDWLEDVVRARRPKRLPVVLSRDDVARLLNALQDIPQLIARLMYGTGMRLLEALRLRVKDVDFARRQVIVRAGKGDKDRYTVLPEALIEPLQTHLQKVQAMHTSDLANGFGSVQLPFALARKYPNADREWGWQYVFPSGKFSTSRGDSVLRRHHLDEKNLQRNIRQAVERCRFGKPVSSHTLRHCFATHLLESGYDIRTIQEPLDQLKHRVSFYEAQFAFADPRRVIAEDLSHSSAEERRHYCYGRTDQGILTVLFTWRDGIVRIIDTGYWRRGKRIYDQQNQIQQ